MGGKTELEKAEKGLSAGVLAMLFLVCVGVCAVFFSLGFLVGTNEQSSRAATIAERVTPPLVIPPTVNPPLRTAVPQPKVAATGATSMSRAASPPRAVPSEPAAVAKAAADEKASAPAPPARASAPTPKIQAEPAPPASTAASGGEVGMGFTVQVAASATKQDAEEVVKILKTRGYPVFLVSPEYAHANDNLFRVQVGPFTSRNDAEKVRAKLVQEGFKQPFVKP